MIVFVLPGVDQLKKGKEHDKILLFKAARQAFHSFSCTQEHLRQPLTTCRFAIDIGRKSQLVTFSETAVCATFKRPPTFTVYDRLVKRSPELQLNTILSGVVIELGFNTS